MNTVWMKYVLRVLMLFIGISVLSGCQTAPKNVWDAIAVGDLKAIKEFLDQGVDLNDARETDYRLPLIHATLHRKPKVIELLLENGADVNVTDAVGNTCLVVAAFLGTEETVRVLLEGSADLFRRNIIGEDALDALEISWEMTNYYANEIYQLGVSQKTIATGREKVRPILLRAREQAAEKDIWAALAIERLDLVKNHVDRVDDLATILTAEGSPILVSATALGHLEIVKYLLQAGADIESRDALGSTSLMAATMFGHEEIAKVLLENDADVHTINYLGTDLNAALQLDWGFTNGIATLIGLSLEEAELKKSRAKTKDLIEARKNAQDNNDLQEQE